MLAKTPVERIGKLEPGGDRRTARAEPGLELGVGELERIVAVRVGEQLAVLDRAQMALRVAECRVRRRPAGRGLAHAEAAVEHEAGVAVDLDSAALGGIDARGDEDRSFIQGADLSRGGIKTDFSAVA